MLSKGNILVVDDEVNLCRILDAKLTKSGYDVMTVHDGLQAVEKVQEKQFDLVLLDLILPKLDGLEALEKIREINSNLPVIIMTACENTDAVSRALAQGASGFVSKPFDLDRLVMLVQNTSTEAHSISTETTIISTSGIFRGGQPVILQSVDNGKGSWPARLLERSQSSLTVALSDPSSGPAFARGDRVDIRIVTAEAMYRFHSSILDSDGGTCYSLDLPHVMYRVQRRRYPRLELKTQVKYCDDASSLTKAGYTEDVGPAGISMITSSPLTQGQEIDFEVKAILHMERFTGHGEVLRCDKVERQDRKRWRIAVKFTEPDPELRRVLLQHLAVRDS